MRIERFFVYLFFLIQTVGLQAQDHFDMFQNDSLSILGQLCHNLREQNPDLARKYGYKALAMAQRSGDSCQIAYGIYYHGNSNNMACPDSAYTSYLKALQIARNCNDDVLLAYLHSNIGALLIRAGDKNGAIPYLIKAKKLALESDRPDLTAVVLNDLALLRLTMSDSAEAIRLFRQALRISSEEPRKLGYAITLLNMAKVIDTNEMSLISMQNEGLHILRQIKGADYQLGSALLNLAVDLPSYQSFPLLRESLKVLGNNYPLIKVAALNMLGYAYAETGHYTEANVIFADSALPLCKSIGSYDWLSTLHDSYADVLVMQRRYKEAQVQQKLALEAQDRANALSGAAQLRLLVTMHDVQQKDEQIRAQARSIEDGQRKMTILRLWFVVTFFALLLVVSSFVWYRQRQKLKFGRQKLESAGEIIQANDMATINLGRELHDIAGLLAAAISGTTGNKEEAINKARTNIRNMSHLLQFSHPSLTFTESIELIAQTYHQCYNATIITNFEIQRELPNNKRMHLLRMITEMLQNSVVHAPGSSISIEGKETGDQLVVIISDTGPGFPEGMVAGAGVKGLYHRALLIGAKLTHISASSGGAVWRILLKTN